MNFTSLSRRAPLLCTSALLATSLLILNCKRSPVASTVDLGADSSSAESPQPAPVDRNTLSPLERQIATQVDAAKAILTGWRQANPERGERKLHIVYWTPSDRDPAPEYQQRLQPILEDIQKFYRQQMQRLGFANHSIKLDYDPQKNLKIHLVRGQHPYDQYAVNSGNQIRKECLPVLEAAGIDAAKETIVIFCNMSVWNAKHRTIRQNSPYYAYGASTHGTAWQVDSPILNLDYLTEKGKHVRDGQYQKVSLGKYNTIFIGGIAHEVGHALGLPHNLARQDEAEALGVALMGSGNFAYGLERRDEGNGAFLTLAHGLKLASHPIFSGHTARMHEDPATELSDLQINSHADSFTVTGKVTGKIPPYAVLAYMDPKGGGDYNATTTSAIPDAEGLFQLDCAALRAGKPADLNLVFLHANGQATSWSSPNTNRYSYSYTVDAKGRPDLSTVQDQLALAPVLKALDEGHAAPVEHLPSDASEKVKAVTERLIKSKDQRRPLPAPVELDSSLKSVTLTDCKPQSLRVGYGRPLFDRLDRSRYLPLNAGGKLFTSGLFAHAISRAEYSLGGKWKSLSGHCGIGGGSRGSVAFRILADGKPIFESPILKDGQNRSFTLDLSGVNSLELITTDGNDGIASDWALWLEMQLSR